METRTLSNHSALSSDKNKPSPSQIEKAREQGYKLAGYYCSYVPLELLDAAGFLSINLIGRDNDAIAEAETILPKNLCPLIKSSFGNAISDEDHLTKEVDLIIGETACDGKKKMYDQLALRKKTYLMQLPQAADRSYSKKMWISEIRHFIEYLRKEYDVEIDDEDIRSAAKKRNELRRIRMELMKLQQNSPVPISGLELYYFLQKLDSMIFLEEAIDEGHRFVADVRKTMSKLEDKREETRILITGCPLVGVADKVVGAVERNGGVVVCFESCRGIKSDLCLVKTEEDIIEALASSYMDIGCSIMSPNNKRMENITELLESFNVHGVIDSTLQMCTTYMIETRAVRKLCDRLGVPFTSLETDYSQEDKGQIDTRIAAFIETIC